MIKKLIIHLGTQKSGSTSIQYSLFNNSSILEKCGFRYMTEWGRSHFHIFRHIFSPYPVKSLENGIYGKRLNFEERENENIIIYNTMMSVMDITKCETLILSGEYWYDLHNDSTIEKFKFFLNKYFYSKGIDICIILLIRNPLSYLISALHTNICIGAITQGSDINIFFEKRMKDYIGLKNLEKHFSDNLILLKFEDAIVDNDGLVGHFLKTIGFPVEKLPDLSIKKINESKCLEVMELIKYIENKEPIIPYGLDAPINPKRKKYGGDLFPLQQIEGVKFDLPYEHKLFLWERLNDTVYMLKNSFGIDYTDYQILPPTEHETYREKTIRGFIEAFPKLSPILQKLYLDFFRNKYLETSQDKFKRLFFEGSIPWKIYNLSEKLNALTKNNLILNESLQQIKSERDSLLNSRSWRITKPFRKIKAIIKGFTH